MAAVARSGRQRGAALILVTWLVALMAALIGAYAATARIEYLQGRVQQGTVVTEAAARAGLEYGLSRVRATDPGVGWAADGRAHPWRFGAAEVEVRLLDESAKLDLNAADPALLAALFRVLGVEAGRAEAVAAAIADWRDTDDLTRPGGAEVPRYAEAGLPYGPKNAPFETVAEVGQVLGMDRALVALAAEHLTVHTGLPQPDPRHAGDQVLLAMGLDPALVRRQREQGPDGPPGGTIGAGSGTYSVESRARLPDGRQSLLRAVVRVDGGGLPGPAYVPLVWEEGATAR